MGYILKQWFSTKLFIEEISENTCVRDLSKLAQHFLVESIHSLNIY